MDAGFETTMYTDVQVLRKAWIPGAAKDVFTVFFGTNMEL